MVVRLAFAVAINVDPEILLVDEALAVGDIYFRQRCMRKVHELRQRGITILFVSHAVSDVKAIGDRVLWLDHGRMIEIGEPDSVVSKYLAAMTEKDSTLPAAQIRRRSRNRGARGPVRAPEIVETIPNIDHRYRRRPRGGDRHRRARRAGARRLHLLEPSSRILVRISVRAKADVPLPMVGFMLRNQLGMDFSGTNTAREGYELRAACRRAISSRWISTSSCPNSIRRLSPSPRRSPTARCWVTRCAIGSITPSRCKWAAPKRRSTATCTCPAASK